MHDIHMNPIEENDDVQNQILRRLDQIAKAVSTIRIILIFFAVLVAIGLCAQVVILLSGGLPK